MKVSEKMSEEKDNKEQAKKYSPVEKQPHVHGPGCSHEKNSELDKHCYYKGGLLSHELFSHLPFSVLSVTIGTVIAGLICFLVSDLALESATEFFNHNHDHDHGSHDHGAHDHAEGEECDGNHGPSPAGFFLLFHLFHPAHILFSAIATTAMFYKYDKSFFKAIIIGFAGSIVICTISDALIPTITAKMMGYSSEVHLCILESPMKVIPFAVIGVFLGIAAVFSGNTKSTITSHSVHVITSTLASLFYTIGSTGKLVWIDHIGTVFMMTVVAVGGICCLSDVIFPLLFTKEAREEYALHGHDHPH